MPASRAMLLRAQEVGQRSKSATPKRQLRFARIEGDSGNERSIHPPAFYFLLVIDVQIRIVVFLYTEFHQNTLCGSFVH
jgi:hypothetical protein